MAKSYKVTVFAGTKVVADMAQQVKNATIEASIQLKTVKGGATSATATILAPGPAGSNRKMEDVEGWFVNGTAAVPPIATGVAWEAPAGKKNTNWWDGTAKLWSLGGSVPLPDSSAEARDWVAGTYTKNRIAVKSGVLYRVKPSVASTTGEPGISADWEEIKSVEFGTVPLSNNIQPPNIFRNGYINTNGNGQFVPTGTNAYMTTGLVPVSFLEVGKTVYFKNIALGYGKFYSYYDKDGNLLQIPDHSGKSLTITNRTALVNARPTEAVHFIQSTVKTDHPNDNTNIATFMILVENISGTTYIPYEVVVNEIDGSPVIPDSVPLVPAKINSPTSKQYVDEQVENSKEIKDPVIYKDDDVLFSGFNGDYAGPAITGWIRDGIEGPVNSVIVFTLPINATGNVINFRIGYVDAVAGFTESSITVLTTVSINKSSLVVSPEGQVTIKFDTVTIPKGKAFVCLPDQPLRVKAYQLSPPPAASKNFYITYKTDGATNWQYGFRYSSGIIARYDNELLIELIQEYAPSSGEGGLYPLSGELIVCFGDSITAPQNAWPSYMSTLLKTRLLNFAVSGARYNDTYNNNTGEKITTIDFSGTAGDDPNNVIFNQVLRFIRHITPLGQQITWSHPVTGETFSVPTELGTGLGNVNDIPKIIVISASTNDSGFGSTSDWPSIMAQNYLDLTRRNLYSSIRWAVETLKIVVPTAQIFLSTPIEGFSRPYSGGATDRADRIMTVGKYFNCQIIDALNESGISEKFERASALGPGRFLADGLHPNARGWELMGNYFAQQIKTKYFPIP